MRFRDSYPPRLLCLFLLDEVHKTGHVCPLQVEIAFVLPCLSERRLLKDLSDLQGTPLGNEADHFLCLQFQVLNTSFSLAILYRGRSCFDTNRTGGYWLVLHVILTFKMADDLELEALRLEIERKSFELESLKTQLALKVRNGK